MVGCLEKRFSDIDIGLLAATKLANFSTWPTVFNESNKDFGDEHVATLTDHFSQTLQQQGVNPAVVELEWNILRSSLYNNHTVADLTWPAVNKILGNECKNILALVDLVLSLPASSAVCERGFSLMKQTKTEYRNRLHTKTLSNLLMVKLHTENEKEYDPTSAIHYWNTGGPKKRRHNFMEDRSNRLSDIVQTRLAAVTRLFWLKSRMKQELLLLTKIKCCLTVTLTGVTTDHVQRWKRRMMSLHWRQPVKIWVLRTRTLIVILAVKEKS
ncbi:zinc finger protein 862-like isoform X2 [Ptychodera flava]|uniref:zinc finger protein 862-like isoform X2 n=1 Tax=Ptychodera flava TaxID=63121 RepID=UPI00396A1BF5